MNLFLHPHNGTSLPGAIDITAHSISLFQENDQPKHINEILVPKTGISIAEPINAQTNQLGNNTVPMYQPIGMINDGKVPGLESISNYTNTNLFSKDEPTISKHHYHITKKTIQQRNI